MTNDEFDILIEKRVYKTMFKRLITRYDSLYVFLVLFVSFFNVIVVMYAPVKIIVSLILFICLLIFSAITHPFAKIALTLVMITFPITLMFGGRDAFSTGTLFIFVIFAWSLTRYRIGYTIFKDRVLFGILFLLICIAFTGMVINTPLSYWGPAARKFVDFISSIAVFILIIHSQNIRAIAVSKRNYVEKIIYALLIIAILHVLLSFIFYFFPSVEPYFSIFFTRTQEHLGEFNYGIFERGTTIFTSGEEFGELLVLLFPFALYKSFSTRSIFNIFITISLLLGVLLTGTRSAFFLIAFELLGFYVFGFRRIKIRIIIILLAIVVIGTVLLPLFSPIATLMMERLKITFLNVGSKIDFLTILNRQLVWPQAYELTKKTLGFIGHGPSQAYVIGFSALNFHSLYLTLLFQFGIIGTIVFLSFFAKLFVDLVKRSNFIIKRLLNNWENDYLLIITCLISLSSFLINEVKFEFNRGSSYQQIIWAVFSIYYLIGHIVVDNKK